MKRLWLLLVMLFLAGCGGGGGGTGSGTAGGDTHSSAGKEATVTVQFNKTSGKSVASAVTYPDPAWVRVVFRNYSGTTEKKDNKVIFDVQLGNDPSFKIPVYSTSKNWTAEAIYFTKDSAFKRMQYYGKTALPFLVDSDNKATITINMLSINTELNPPTDVNPGLPFEVRAKPDTNFYLGSSKAPELQGLFAPEWSLAVRPSEITTALHLATLTPVADYLGDTRPTAPNFPVGSKIYLQGEFFINKNLIGSGERITDWTYNYNLPAVTLNVYQPIGNGSGGSIFDDSFPPKMTGLAVSTFQSDPSHTFAAITPSASDNIQVTQYCIKQSATSTTPYTAPPDPTSLTPTKDDTCWKDASAMPLTDLTLTGTVQDDKDNYVYLYGWARDKQAQTSTATNPPISAVYTSPMITYNNSPQVSSFTVNPAAYAKATEDAVIGGITLKGTALAPSTFLTGTTLANAVPVAASGTTSFTYTGKHDKHDNFVTLYGWIQDKNSVYAVTNAVVNVTDRPQVNFVVTEAGKQISSATVNVTGLTATYYDGKTTTGTYAITETSIAPDPTDTSAWKTMPSTGSTTYTFADTTNGVFVTKHLFLWVKDSSDVISLPQQYWISMKF